MSLTPCQSSYDVVVTALVELRFLRYTIVSAIFIYSLLSNFASAIIVLTFLIIVCSLILGIAFAIREECLDDNECAVTVKFWQADF